MSGNRGDFGSIAASEASGATAHIPGQSTVRIEGTVDRSLNGERNRIERVFDHLAALPGIAIHVETATDVLAAIHLAAVRLWARLHQPTT